MKLLGLALLVAPAEKLSAVRGRLDLEAAARDRPHKANYRREHDHREHDENYQGNHASSVLPDAERVKEREAAFACVAHGELTPAHDAGVASTEAVPRRAEPSHSGSLSERLFRKRNGSRSTEREREPREHRQIGVKLNAPKPANAQERQSILVLQTSKLTLNRGATAVEAAPFVALAWNAKVALFLAPAEWDDRRTVALS